MERPLACGCTTGECDGLTCGFVVTTTAHDHNMTDHHTVEQDSGVCVDTQVAPKAHHPNKSSGPEHGCLLNRQHPDHDQPIVNDGQYGDGIAQEARVERLSPQQTVEVSSHEMTETLNVLVNDRSSIWLPMLDLIAPPKLTSEITQLPR